MKAGQHAGQDMDADRRRCRNHELTTAAFAKLGQLASSVNERAQGALGEREEGPTRWGELHAGRRYA